MNGLVVGMGSIGKRHYNNLKQLGLLDNVVGIDIEDSLSNALNNKPDVVFICTPARSHIDVALEVASRQIPYFIEKPLSHSMNNIKELLQLSTSTPNMIACNIRFQPSYNLLSRLFDPKSRGFLQVVFGHNLKKWKGINERGLGENIALESIHEIDYCDWVLKGIKNLSGFSYDRRASFSGEAWDGSVVSISVDSLAPRYVRKCRLVYDNYEAVADFQNNNVTVFYPDGEVKLDCAVKDMYVEELKSFLGSIKKGEESVNPVREASRVLELVLKTQDCSNYPGEKVLSQTSW